MSPKSLSFVVICFIIVNTVKTEEVSQDNILIRFAKSLAFEALSEFKESSRRNPKLGFNFTFPLVPNNGTKTSNSTDFLGPLASLGSLGTNGVAIPMTIGVSSGLKKTAIISIIAGLKSILWTLAISILWLAFLISGTAYFVCNLGLVSCSNLGGSGSGGGSSLFGANERNSFLGSRSGLEEQYERQTQPVYKAIDEGFKRYQ